SHLESAIPPVAGALRSAVRRIAPARVRGSGGPARQLALAGAPRRVDTLPARASDLGSGQRPGWRADDRVRRQRSDPGRVLSHAPRMGTAVAWRSRLDTGARTDAPGHPGAHRRRAAVGAVTAGERGPDPRGPAARGRP